MITRFSFCLNKGRGHLNILCVNVSMKKIVLYDWSFQRIFVRYNKKSALIKKTDFSKDEFVSISIVQCIQSKCLLTE